MTDDHTSEMAKDIEKEEGGYGCGLEKGHTTSTFFMPVHHIPNKRRAHVSEMQGALKRRRKKKFREELRTRETTGWHPILNEKAVQNIKDL